MNLTKKETVALFFGLSLVGSVFSGALLVYLFPETQVMEAKIFDIWENPRTGDIHILTYGKGKIIITEDLNLELDCTYQFVYNCNSINFQKATTLISVTKLEPEFERIWSFIT